ncbi:MAG TPA: sugar phosphate isomerase/epimerase family protein [Tepidisphaeraceae bacterium]|jgi:sugar phosphate isomerase/epimerase|nr:sugar phosphate isomerase/epimerase family protein [Tepidisphaeraceae bacterium]
MPTAPLSRLCIHTITTKPLALPAAVKAYRDAGAAGITVWRDAIVPLGVKESARILADSGLKVVSLCRGGFFPAASAADRQKALDDNRRVIDEAAAIGAPLVVLVCGAAPGVPLAEARKQIAGGIAAVIPHATPAGIKLGIEPLHPMYADTRSAINTLSQANDIVENLRSPGVGVTIDVYHVWWDERLEAEIARCGRLGAIFSYHVCDWRSPTRDLLLDRGLMGEGCIPLGQIRSRVEKAGFDGMIEVEIFSSEFWQMDQLEFVKRLKSAYLEHA